MKKNIMALAKVKKVVVNMGTGDMASKSKESFNKLIEDMKAITGQKPQIRKARLSVAGFGIREGLAVGLRVTLRGKRMNDFLKRLVATALPRIRDFRGISASSFDKNGNYTLGIIDHTIFPEIDLIKIDKPHGLEVSVVTNAGNRETAFELLSKFGFPFEKDLEQNK